MVFAAWDLGFGIWGLGFKAQSFEFRPIVRIEHEQFFQECQRRRCGAWEALRPQNLGLDAHVAQESPRFLIPYLGGIGCIGRGFRACSPRFRV